MQLEPDQFADIVATAIKLAMQPLVARIAVLERREAVPGPEGKPGRDGETVVGPPGEMGLTGPKGDPGQDGSSVTLDDVAPLVKAIVVDAVAAIPVPKDGIQGWPGEKGEPGPAGKDGVSVTLEDVAPVVRIEVSKAVAAIPVPKDGTPGKDGEPGPAGKDADPLVLKALEDELQALRSELELKTAAPTMTVHQAEEISQSVEALFRKELGLQESRAPRKQKRVLRDADGKIDRVVEEVMP